MIDQPVESPPGRRRQYGGPEPRIHYLIFRDFQTMDTQLNRIGLPANRLAWCENLQPLGPNNLLQVPGPIAATSTITGKTVFRQFYATFGSPALDYIVMFMTDGSAYTVTLPSGVQTQFAPAGTFAAPDMAQWASDRILMVDSKTGYCQWDGTVFVQAGGVSPNIVITNAGSGYTTAPSVTITGGSGSGATAQAFVSGGAVVRVQLLGAGTGYKAGDTLTVTFGGPGVNAAATAIVWPILTMPNQTTLAVFQGRVWIGANRTLLWTGTKGFDDVLAANASGSTILSDSDLPHQITAIRAFNNFLFIFGDGSVKQIGTIAVSAGVTLFTIVTLTSDQGTTFLMSIVAFNRLTIFANTVGVFAIFGATVEKISDPMDGLFRQLDFTLSPCGASIDVNNVRCFLLLVRYLDPVQGPRSIFLTFFNRKWFVISQGTGILTCVGAELSGVFQLFTSAGPDITRVLADPTVPISIIVRTALSDDNQPMQNKRGIRIGIAQSSTTPGTVTLTEDTETTSFTDSYPFGLPITWLNNSGGIVTWLNNPQQPVTFVTGGFQFQDKQFNGSGLYLGASITGTFAKFNFFNLIIEYESGMNPMRSINHR